MPAATSFPSASAAARRRHGNATTIWSRSCPGRARTASRRAPPATAILRVRNAAIRATTRRRCSLSGGPVLAPPGTPSRSAIARIRSSLAVSQPGTARVSLIAGRVK